MKRNWDVMRDVLLEVEAMTPAQAEKFQYTEDRLGVDEASIRSRHAFLLFQKGYLSGIHGDTLSDGKYLMSPALTMDGANLLDEIRDPRLWNKVKEVAKEKGVGIAFDSLKALITFAATKLLAS